MYCTALTGDPGVIDLYQVPRNDWSETTLNWENRPMRTIYLDTRTVSGTGFAEWDVTEVFFQALSEGATELSLKLESQTNNYQVFSSSEGAANLAPAIYIDHFTSISEVSTQQLSNQLNTCYNPCYASIVDVNVSDTDWEEKYNLTDCDLNTRWSAEWDGGAWEYAKLELESPTTITHSEIAFYLGDQRTNNFWLLFYKEDNTWIGSFNFISSGTSLGYESFATSVSDVKYVYYFGNGNSQNNWVSLTDMRLKTPAACRLAGGSNPQVIDPVEALEGHEEPLLVVPNPAETQVRVMNLQDQEKWELYNDSGQKISDGSGEILDLTRLPSGLYILRTNKGRTAKVVKI